MAFQFPSDPRDGDIIVRGDIQAFYNEATNSWRLSQMDQIAGVPGPPGPAGPSGPPGSGVDIKGAVDSFNDLPLPNGHQFEFWVVDDTNTLYFSDGQQWIDFGSPIQGPKGETGNDGVDGDDGSNGQNGRGWYDTSIIDERPNNYQISFLSNDGLTFVTDNIMGPAGATGEIPVASATRLGGIKIGRGLNILPDGTAQAGETNVDLETVPLGPDGQPAPLPTINNYSLGFAPGYFNQPDNKTSATSSFSAGPSTTQSGVIQVPAKSNGAIVYFFTGSNVSNNFSPPGGYGLNWTVFANLVATLEIGGATFVSNANKLGIPMVHNYAIGSETRRTSEVPALKIGQITYPFGTTELSINVNTVIAGFQRASVTYGRCRVIVLPYRDSDEVEEFNALTPQQRISLYTDDVESGESYEPIDPADNETIIAFNAANLKWELVTQIEAIDMQLLQTYTSGPIYDQLLEVRQQLLDLQELPGTYEDIYAEFQRLSALVKPYTSITFRFE